MDLCEEIYVYYIKTISYFVYSIAILLNILAALAFSSNIVTRDSKDNIFTYLFLKSVCEVFNYARYLLANFCYNEVFWFLGTFLGCTITLPIIYYFGLIAMMASMLFELAANVDLYKKITNRMKLLERISFKIKVLVILITCFGFYIYMPLQLECINFYEGNYTYYYL